jgi:ABC-type amino acid transport/signal transduction systems, periplasmic component/domain
MKKTVSVILALLICFSLFANGSKESASASYKFASDCTWPPLEYVDESGKIVGFEIDLISEFQALSGKEMIVLNTGWDGIFAGLKNGAYDAVASGVTVTEERKNTMDFSDTILTVTQSILVKKGTEGLKTIDDLNGKKVGVQVGTTGDFALDGKTQIVKMGYDEIPLAVEDLINGNVDAVVCDSLIAADFVLANQKYQDLLVVTGTASEEVEEIAIAVAKGNTELLSIINSSLKTLNENGKIAELKAKYNIL